MTNEERIAELERQLKETKHLHEIDRFHLVDQANRFQAMAQDATAEIKRLKEQLQNAIVPKFKVGQMVFFPAGVIFPYKASITAVYYASNELSNLRVMYDIKVRGRLCECIPESWIFAPREKNKKHRQSEVPNE